MLLAGLTGVLSGGDKGEQAVSAYAQAWSARDWASMHAQLTPRSKRSFPLLEFARANGKALATATVLKGGITAGRPRSQGDGRWRIRTAVRTRLFGVVRGSLLLRVDTTSDDPRIVWARHLVFPGLRAGEELTRSTSMPERGTLLARDRTPLAEGPARASSIPDVAAEVVGQLGPIPAERLDELTSLGVPANAQVGVSGLERVFDRRLAGTPAGTLRAGGRVLARGAGRAGGSVRTTLAPDLVRSSVAALAGRQGGAVALDPRNGAVLGYSGVPFSILQPPGSTFKIVTAAAALESGDAKLGDRFESRTFAILSGVELANAYDESCGGTFEETFAYSCNSVFAPLGARVGAQKLVAMAEKFGFNAPSPITIAAESKIPAAGTIGDDLAVGSTAIGQGRVQATALQMADLTATIARGGRRAKPTLDLERAGRVGPRSGERVVNARTARVLDRMMRAVVRYGTGSAASLPSTPVAGKTGTAELRPRAPTTDDAEPEPRDPEDTDAWFVAFAPAGPDRTPRVVVAVLLIGSGAGGDTAAPAARGLLIDALKRGG